MSPECADCGDFAVPGLLGVAFATNSGRIGRLAYVRCNDNYTFVDILGGD